MKKLLTTLTCITLLSTGIAMANDCDKDFDCPPPPPKCKMKKPPHERLNEKLNLTEAQKTLLKKNRIESRKKMKPIMQQMFNKHEAIADIRASELSQSEQDKKIAPLKQELKALKTKANEIRKADMTYFESVLTTEQKTEFEKIKKEHKQMKGKRPTCPSECKK